MRLFYLLPLFFAFSVLAQPNVTQAHLPAVGQSMGFGFHNFMGDWEDPMGTNQNWDFSTLQFTNGPLVTYQTPGSVPGGGQFPLATMAQDFGSGVLFFRSTSAGFEQVGEYMPFVSNPVQAKITYQPPLRLYPLGLTFSQSQIATSKRTTYDSLDATTYAKTISTVRREFTYVAWGNLTLPNASPALVMVIRSTETKRDSVFTSTSGINGNYVFDEVFEPGDPEPPDYMFIQAGTPALLLSAVTYEDGEGNLETVLTRYSGTPATGREENLEAEMFQLFPNPSQGQDVRLTNLPEGVKVILVQDMMGREVARFQVQGQKDLDVKAGLLAPGLYGLQLLDMDGRIGLKTQKLLVTR
jgi:hypothetical protein